MSIGGCRSVSTGVWFCGCVWCSVFCVCFCYVFVFIPTGVIRVAMSIDCIHEPFCDVCVIGSGPHALSVVSRLKEVRPRHLSDRDLTTLRKYYIDDAHDSLNQVQSVTVVDPSGKWMAGWDESFQQQAIQWLRSPVTAHPGPSNWTNECNTHLDTTL